MMRSIQRLSYFLSALFLFAGCQKKDWDEYYGKPDDLAPPIYQQLQARGNFKSLLTLIDKSGYKDILGRSGAWTFFAANDDAFAKYFQENNIKGADSVSTELARKIATYGLVYNPYRKDQLTSAQTNQGRVVDAAFRRKTAYYDFVYTENGKKVVDNSRNGTTIITNENNNKYIPYFISSYFTTNLLNEANTFSTLYPGKTSSGFDVAGAKVIEQDIPAENGIIHVVDKVITPLPNIDQYIASNPNYSEFKKLLDKLAVYIPSADFTERYRTLTNSNESVSVKAYNAGLAFSPNNEGYMVGTTDGQVYSWSIAAPTNDALVPYMNTILEYYKTFEAAPPSILLNLVNSHMWRNTAWPERVIGEPNAQSEVATFAKSNVIENKLLSNGFFYGVNKVHEANIFRTVYAASFLNPKLSYTNRVFELSDAKLNAQTPTRGQTQLLMTDSVLNLAGYRFREDSNQWEYTAPGASPAVGNTSADRINRIIQSGLLFTPEGEFNNLSGVGIAEGYNQEYIKFENNKIYAAGNAHDNTPVTVTASRDYVNGRVYFISGILKFSEDAVTVGTTLEKLATGPLKNNYSHFFDYLKSSSLWTAGSKDITGVDKGAFYTFLIPTNAAIEQAIREGRLPGTVAGTVVTPKFLQQQQTGSERVDVENFIRYSIITKATIAVDGKKAATYQTLLKNAVGDSRLVTVDYNNSKNPADFKLIDDATIKTSATADLAASNQLANRALIHSINQVLKFK